MLSHRILQLDLRNHIQPRRLQNRSHIHPAALENPPPLYRGLAVLNLTQTLSSSPASQLSPWVPGGFPTSKSKFLISLVMRSHWPWNSRRLPDRPLQRTKTGTRTGVFEDTVTDSRSLGTRPASVAESEVIGARVQGLGGGGWSLWKDEIVLVGWRVLRAEVLGSWADE